MGTCGKEPCSNHVALGKSCFLPGKGLGGRGTDQTIAERIVAASRGTDVPNLQRLLQTKPDGDGTLGSVSLLPWHPSERKSMSMLFSPP